MARLTPEQQQNLATILRVGQHMGAPKKAVKAAVEAGLVESGLRNLKYGDRDSVGVFQQRASQGWTGLTNVEGAAREFFQHAIPLVNKYGTAGQLAQAVQRSAFPARYDQQSGTARALLRGNASSPRSSKSVSSSGSFAGTANTGGTDNTALALSLLGISSDYGVDPLQLAITAALQKGPASRGSKVSSPSGGSTQGQTKGTAYVDGKPVVPWIAQILKRAKAAGWKGTVTSGERTKQQQLSAAKNYGLQHYPNGPLASNHVVGHDGAVDVSDPEGLKAVLKKLGITSLKSSMPEDKVHFSRTGF